MTHKVVCGTSMGMIPAGSISDSVLYTNLERDYILKSSARRKFLICFYARFPDDIILIIGADLDSVRVLLDEMRFHARPFVVTLDSVSKKGFQMLHVEATVTNDRLSFVCFKKHQASGGPSLQSHCTRNPFMTIGLLPNAVES